MTVEKRIVKTSEAIPEKEKNMVTLSHEKIRLIVEAIMSFV